MPLVHKEVIIGPDTRSGRLLTVRNPDLVLGLADASIVAVSDELDSPPPWVDLRKKS